MQCRAAINHNLLQNNKIEKTMQTPTITTTRTARTTTFTATPGVGAMINASDFNRPADAIAEFIDNSIHYSSNGGTDIRVGISMWIKGNDEAFLLIKDEGDIIDYPVVFLC